MSKPSDNLQPQDYERAMQQYIDALIQRLLAFNKEFSHRPQIFEFAIFKTVEIFATTRLMTASRNKTYKELKECLIDYQLNLFNRLHAQLPQFNMKEMVFGWICSKNMLFHPQIPSLANCNGDED